MFAKHLSEAKSKFVSATWLTIIFYVATYVLFCLISPDILFDTNEEELRVAFGFALWMATTAGGIAFGTTIGEVMIDIDWDYKATPVQKKIANSINVLGFIMMNAGWAWPFVAYFIVN